MRIVAKIPYKAVTPVEVAELENLAVQGFSLHVFCDSATEQIVLVV